MPHGCIAVPLGAVARLPAHPAAAEGRGRSRRRGPRSPSATGHHRAAPGGTADSPGVVLGRHSDCIAVPPGSTWAEAASRPDFGGCAPGASGRTGGPGHGAGTTATQKRSRQGESAKAWCRCVTKWGTMWIWVERGGAKGRWPDSAALDLAARPRGELCPAESRPLQPLRFPPREGPRPTRAVGSSAGRDAGRRGRRSGPPIPGLPSRRPASPRPTSPPPRRPTPPRLPA